MRNYRCAVSSLEEALMQTTRGSLLNHCPPVQTFLDESAQQLAVVVKTGA
jgi:hypothetical protein